jgi:phosphoglycolate phosphatase-like HAD superfamily hydrolase
VRRQLREHEVSAMFRTKVCSEDAPHRKPHPAPLRMALERLGLSPKVCVYVGDAPEDIEMAHRAGMRAIGVLGGSPVPERLRGASPDAMIETIRELPALLRNF